MTSLWRLLHGAKRSFSTGRCGDVRPTTVAMAWRMGPGGIMCFSPTLDEFRDFSAFVAYMEDQGAHKCGIAKVSPFFSSSIALRHVLSVGHPSKGVVSTAQLCRYRLHCDQYSNQSIRFWPAGHLSTVQHPEEGTNLRRVCC